MANKLPVKRDWLKLLGKFHPASVHLPIAMLIAALFAEFLLMVNGRPSFQTTMRFCLWLGMLGAITAATLGWFHAEHTLFSSPSRKWTVGWHRWLGVGTAVWALVCLVLAERAARRADASRKWLRLALLLGAGLVGVTGAFGGALVYTWKHYQW